MQTHSLSAGFWIQLALFGVAGVFARVELDAWFGTRPPAFPTGIFVINLLGSFAAGVLLNLDRARFAPLGMGFLGGFTTFSTFSAQTLALLQSGEWALAAAYGIGSPVVGLAAAFVGGRLTQ